MASGSKSFEGEDIHFVYGFLVVRRFFMMPFMTSHPSKQFKLDTKQPEDLWLWLTLFQPVNRQCALLVLARMRQPHSCSSGIFSTCAPVVAFCPERMAA
jgi:hypothetical protein